MDINLMGIEKVAATCMQCDLSKTRTHPVFARGNLKSPLMIVGMVPGPDEDIAGTPFVGRAGQLLDKILYTVDIKEVYITNLVKCWLKPGLPLKDEWVEACLPYILSQIVLMRPRIILTLGLDASRTLLSLPAETKMFTIRGEIYSYGENIKIVPTYHPSYLLRSGGDKSDKYPTTLKDFQLAKNLSQ